MVGFVWELCVSGGMLMATQTALRDLTVRVRAALPLAYAALIPTYGNAAAFLDSAGEPLDLSDVPFELVMEVAEFFGPGCWVFPGEGTTGVRVVKAYKS